MIWECKSNLYIDFSKVNMSYVGQIMYIFCQISLEFFQLNIKHPIFRNNTKITRCYSPNKLLILQLTLSSHLLPLFMFEENSLWGAFCSIFWHEFSHFIRIKQKVNITSDRKKYSPTTFKMIFLSDKHRRIRQKSCSSSYHCKQR